MIAEDFINKCLLLLSKGFSKEQIREEVWKECLKEYHNNVRLDSIILMSMEIWEEVVIRAKKFGFYD